MSEEIWTPRTVTMPSGVEVQPLTPDDENENSMLECIELAKQAWLSDNPGSTELGWELISNLERDSYVFKEFRDAGYKQYEYMGRPAFRK
ncbi:MAG: hypothetical protein VW862_08865 [Euryarchaeota archaeon]|jgi:hypothetical protein